MSSLQLRHASRAPVSAVNHAARLELLEYYLVHHEDLIRCALASLDWLARHAGIKRAACLAVDSESGTLVGIAGLGVPQDDVELFSWPLSDSHDSLVSALNHSEPTTFRNRSKVGEGLFGYKRINGAGSQGFEG